MIRAVIFDMDGVLVDSEPKNLEQLKGFYESFGTQVDDAFLASLVGSSETYTYDEGIRILGKDWNHEEMERHFLAYTKEHPVHFDEILNEGVLELLVWLKAQGYKVAVASSSKKVQIEEMAQVCGLRQYFDVILSGEMFKESKPNPEIYEEAARQLGVKPGECIAVEDSSYGIEAGIRAGMCVLAYRDERYGVDQSKASFIIDEFHEVKQYVRVHKEDMVWSM